tara:strand:- start:873 stop:1337 length:465 start_codon:yes stop_codon:yes gene_type:complete
MFGFIKEGAKKAGKKMYGYGQKTKGVVEKYPGATIGGAGLATIGGLTAGGVMQPDWDGSKQLGMSYIENYMKNDHGKWLKSEFNAKKDIPHIMEVMDNTYNSLRFRMHGSSQQEINDAHVGIYQRFLKQASTRKGSPSAEELHNMLRSAKFGGR